MAVTGAGKVVAWGGNSQGQTNIPSSLSNVVAVACGRTHSIAIKSDGTVAAWGADAGGATNVPPGLSNVIAVAAGIYHSLALKRDGTVVRWGWNYSPFPWEVPSGLSNVVAITAGGRDSAAQTVPLSIESLGILTNGLSCGSTLFQASSIQSSILPL